MKDIEMMKFYTQKVLPLVYDDSLSYYEVLCKVSAKLNEVIGSQNDVNNAFAKLQEWIAKQLMDYAEDELNEMYADGRLAELINTQLFGRLDDKINQIYLNILDYKQLVPDWENIDLNEGDWTEAIKQAIKDASTIGSNGKNPVIYFPHFGTGEYKTKPISLLGYNDIVFKGGGAEIHKNNHYLWGDETKPTNFVRIHFTERGDVGFKTASTVNPYVEGTQYCHGITFENLWLYGGNNVDVCVNGNYDFTLKNVRCSHALLHCVELEDYTYPCYIHECNFGPSSGNGLYVRGRYSTIYTLDNINANLNAGYGFVIEGGAYASIIDCSAHANKRGGLKITKRNDLYQSENYLTGLLFINFYTEANGTYDISDPRYDGNYALVINRIGEPLDGVYEARYIKFINGAFNYGANSNSLNIDSVFGLYFDNVSAYTKTDKCRYNEAQGLYFGVRPTYVDIPPFPWRSTNSRTIEDEVFTLKNEHQIVRKGRPHVVGYFSHNVVTSEGAMKVAGMTGGGTIDAGFPINKGSIVGMKIVAYGRPTDTGTLTASLVTAPTSNLGNGLTWYKQDVISINLTTEHYKEVYFDFLEHYFNEPTMIGVRLNAKDITGDITDVAVYLIVED